MPLISEARTHDVQSNSSTSRISDVIWGLRSPSLHEYSISKCANSRGIYKQYMRMDLVPIPSPTGSSCLPTLQHLPRRVSPRLTTPPTSCRDLRSLGISRSFQGCVCLPFSFTACLHLALGSREGSSISSSVSIPLALLQGRAPANSNLLQ